MSAIITRNQRQYSPLHAASSEISYQSSLQRALHLYQRDVVDFSKNLILTQRTVLIHQHRPSVIPTTVKGSKQETEKYDSAKDQYAPIHTFRVGLGSRRPHGEERADYRVGDWNDRDRYTGTAQLERSPRELRARSRQPFV